MSPSPEEPANQGPRVPRPPNCEHEDITPDSFDKFARQSKAHPYFEAEGKLKWPQKTRTREWKIRGRILAADHEGRKVQVGCQGKNGLFQLTFSPSCICFEDCDLQRDMDCASRRAWVIHVELNLSLAFIAWTRPDPGSAIRRLSHPIDCVLPIHTLMYGLHYCGQFWKHTIRPSLRVLDTSSSTTIFGRDATPLAGDTESRTTILSLYNLYYGRGGLAAHTDDKYVREQLTRHLALPASKSRSSLKRIIDNVCKFVHVVLQPIFEEWRRDLKTATPQLQATRQFSTIPFRTAFQKIFHILDQLSAAQGHWLFACFPMNAHPFLKHSSSSRDAQKAFEFEGRLKHLTVWLDAHFLQPANTGLSDMRGTAAVIEKLVQTQAQSLATRHSEWRKVWCWNHLRHFVVNPKLMECRWNLPQDPGATPRYPSAMPSPAASFASSITGRVVLPWHTLHAPRDEESVRLAVVWRQGWRVQGDTWKQNDDDELPMPSGQNREVAGEGTELGDGRERLERAFAQGERRFAVYVLAPGLPSDEAMFWGKMLQPIQCWDCKTGQYNCNEDENEQLYACRQGVKAKRVVPAELQCQGVWAPLPGYAGRRDPMNVEDAQPDNITSSQWRQYSPLCDDDTTQHRGTTLVPIVVPSESRIRDIIACSHRNGEREEGEDAHAYSLANRGGCTNGGSRPEQASGSEHCDRGRDQVNDQVNGGLNSSRAGLDVAGPRGEGEHASGAGGEDQDSGAAAGEQRSDHHTGTTSGPLVETGHDDSVHRKMEEFAKLQNLNVADARYLYQGMLRTLITYEIFSWNLLEQSVGQTVDDCFPTATSYRTQRLRTQCKTQLLPLATTEAQTTKAFTLSVAIVVPHRKGDFLRLNARGFEGSIRVPFPRAKQGETAVIDLTPNDSAHLRSTRMRAQGRGYGVPSMPIGLVTPYQIPCHIMTVTVPW
jgi:hypothetical protein